MYVSCTGESAVRESLRAQYPSPALDVALAHHSDGDGGELLAADCEPEPALGADDLPARTHAGRFGIVCCEELISSPLSISVLFREAFAPR